MHFADDPAARIKRVRVFVDNNPSPLVATFELGAPAVTQIDLHVRIDRFTSVRAVAERADGRLEMRSAWVKASGGCSAPPGAAAGGTLGEVRLRPGEDAKSLLVSIRHPNSSGFQIDPRTGDDIPAHYISHIRIEAGGRTSLDAETGISVSENPTLRIASDQSLPVPVTVEAVDSVTQAHFTASTSSPRTAATELPRRRMAGADQPIGCAARPMIFRRRLARCAIPRLLATTLLVAMLGGADNSDMLAVDELAAGVYVHRGASCRRCARA